ncbi:hypothetical protein [Halogranum amylolyticum]|uniref:hypothetical protein n=1 Tax=Halogranum amylolyticum TaxID=660520 RepID=UPI000A81F298|nr:hypothetical protein [Halogranum amylolyticum]
MTAAASTSDGVDGDPDRLSVGTDASAAAVTGDRGPTRTTDRRTGYLYRRRQNDRA